MFLIYSLYRSAREITNTALQSPSPSQLQRQTLNQLRCRCLLQLRLSQRLRLHRPLRLSIQLQPQHHHLHPYPRKLTKITCPRGPNKPKAQSTPCIRTITLTLTSTQALTLTETRWARNSRSTSRGTLVAEIVCDLITYSVPRMGNPCAFRRMTLRFQRIKGRAGNAATNLPMTIINIRYAHLNQRIAEMACKTTTLLQR